MVRRVLLTKSVLDAHDRGIRVIATMLREAGMEVIFTRFAMPAEIVKTAIEEDVDVIGISSLVGGHINVVSQVMQGLRDKGVLDKLVVLGGIIPEEDQKLLFDMGVERIFGPGEKGDEVIAYIQNIVGPGK